jgi:hypothetical protein
VAPSPRAEPLLSLYPDLLVGHAGPCVPTMNLTRRVASRWIAAQEGPGLLDGFDRRQAVAAVNKIIASAKLDGIFRDAHWEPIQRIWAAMNKANLDWYHIKNWYDKDKEGNPSAKTWAVGIEWKDKAGKNQEMHVRVIASGAGSVKEPLDAYDVVALVS